MCISTGPVSDKAFEVFKLREAEVELISDDELHKAQEECTECQVISKLINYLMNVDWS